MFVGSDARIFTAHADIVLTLFIFQYVNVKHTGRYLPLTLEQLQEHVFNDRRAAAGAVDVDFSDVDIEGDAQVNFEDDQVDYA